MPESKRISPEISKSLFETSPELVSWDELTEKYQSLLPKAWDEASLDVKWDTNTETDISDASSPKEGSKLADPQEHMIPSRSLWIGNIDDSCSSELLLDIFSKFGSVESVRMLPEKECAFVNFSKVDDALAAREKMHGANIGSTIVRIGFGKTDAIQDTQTMQPTKSLWVGNIPSLTKPAELGALFEKYGKVESARVLVLIKLT
jgi:RNA recognition motif-containing protein